MKTIILFSLLFSNSLFAQTKTFNSLGKTYHVMEFNKTYTIDSCLTIEKNNTGWAIPDTAQLRSIHSQLPEINGLKFLSSTKYEGDNYIQVDMYNPIKKFIAPSDNMNQPAYYTLVLIKEKE
ncbi:MAG TPA: hypothetical protein VN722_08430 [Hanamia sp.]|nr:hypothetical protein [Hanamia sp.]